MDPDRQLDYLIRGQLRAAVDDFLGGDWSRLPALFTVPRARFDAWADSVALPVGRVFKERSPHDGIYVLRDAEGWLVFEQKKGAHLPGERVYPDYRQAKRAALALELRAMLRGAR